jgi:tetratricopeptide (TPR) repeat protein
LFDLAWQLKAWVFVHNHPEGKLGKRGAEAISDVKSQNPLVEITVLNIDGLWEKLTALSDETLKRLFGERDAGATSAVKRVEKSIPANIKCLFDEGGKFIDEGRYAQAREKFELAKRAAETQNCSSALMKARIDISETQILEQRDIALARDDLLACLRELPADAESDQRHKVLCLLGDAELIIGSVLEAKSLYREGHLIAHGQKDRFAEARNLVGLSHTEELLGNLKEAHRLLDEATELYRAEYRETTGEEKRRTAINLGGSFSTKAKFLRHEAKLAEALACLARAEPLFREAENHDNVGRTLIFRAEILFNETNTEDGFAALKEALSTFESIGNVVWQCRCLDAMAKFFFQSRNESGALACLGRALYLVNSERPDIEAVSYLLKLAHLCRDHDQTEKAKAFIERAKEIATNAKDGCLVAECLVAEARNHEGNDAHSAREELFKSAVKHLESALPNCEVKGRRAQYMHKLGDLYGWLRSVHEARAWFERALHEFEEIGDVIGMGASLASLAAAAREEKSPADAIAALERLVAFCEGKPLHYGRAGALHDLEVAKLSEGDVTGATRCLEAAKRVAEKHGFKDVLDKLRLSLEHLEHERRVRQPPHRDFPSLIRELHDWCERYPKFSKGILPVWYYLHRAEFWSICRSLLGVKFLICAVDSADFRRVAGTLRAQGDLFTWGINIALKTKPRTELIPFPMDFLIPPHLKTALFKQPPNDTKDAVRALAGTLEHDPYVMLPFTDDVKSRHGTCLYIYGMHVRLAPMIYKMMLNTPSNDLIAERKICLPLSQHDEAPGLMQIMHAASENGLIPIFSERLPHHETIKSECDCILDTPNSATMTGVSESIGSMVKQLWVKLLSSCQQTPQASLSDFSRAWERWLRSTRRRMPCGPEFIFFGSKQEIEKSCIPRRFFFRHEPDFGTTHVTA